MSKPETIIHVNSIVSHRTREGVVQLIWGEMQGQLSPAVARAHALKILECADAAESDAFMLDFFCKKLGAGESQAGQILLEFRKFREKREKENMS